MSPETASVAGRRPDQARSRGAPGRWLRRFGIGLLGALLAAGGGTAVYLLWPAPPPPPTTVSVPTADDWIDFGPIFASGEAGDWDHHLYGAFAATAVRFADATYFYYQGASGYRTVDESVTGRAIGVATSPDGVAFTKFNGNPVLTWAPRDGGEEGAVSSGAVVDDGTIWLYYGANSLESPTTINADARLARSTDGLTFADVGLVLDHADPTVWGAGDELFPIIALKDGDRWIVYYLPNGRTMSRHRLGVAWGAEPLALAESRAARLGPRRVEAWGTGGYAFVGPQTVALFLNDGEGATTVYLVNTRTPHRLSKAVATYAFADYHSATVLLDARRRTWFMYYRNGDQSHYGLRLAPAGPADRTPPSPPASVALVDENGRHRLTWSPASDADTGVAQYRIYRAGQFVAATSVQSYAVDQPGGDAYQVSAVNFHGVEGPAAIAVPASPEASSP